MIDQACNVLTVATDPADNLYPYLAKSWPLSVFRPGIGSRHIRGAGPGRYRAG